MSTSLATIPVAGSSADGDLGFLVPVWLERSRLMRIALVSVAVVVVGVAASQGPIEGALAVMVVALALLIAHRPVIGVLVMAAVVPITSGLARGLPVPGFRVSELLTALIAGTVLLTVPRERSRPWAIFDFAALAYALATLVLGAAAVAARHASLSFEDIGTLVGPIQFLLIYRVTVVVIRRSHDRLRVLYVLVAASAPVAMIGILQQLDVGPFRAVVQSLTEVNLSTDFSYQLLARATGPFDHWQALGGYLFIVILLGVALLTERPPNRLRALLIGVLALDVSALLLSASIAPTVCTLLGAAAISVWASRRSGWGRLRPVLAVGGVAFLVSLVFLPVVDTRAALQFGHGTSAGQDSVVPHSLAYRYDIWIQQYLPALQDHWLAGYGPQLPPAIHWQYTESLYITLLLRGGIALLLSFIGLMVAAAVRARQASRDREQGARVAGRVLLVAIIALIPMHAEIPYFVNSGLPHVFWILIGVAGSRTLETGRARPGRKLQAAV